VGALVGAADGTEVEGALVGALVGDAVGGAVVGAAVGSAVVGAADGTEVTGAAVGAAVGAEDGGSYTPPPHAQHACVAETPLTAHFQFSELVHMRNMTYRSHPSPSESTQLAGALRQCVPHAVWSLHAAASPVHPTHGTCDQSFPAANSSCAHSGSTAPQLQRHIPVNQTSARQVHAAGFGKHSARDFVGASAAPTLAAVFVAPAGQKKRRIERE